MRDDDIDRPQPALYILSDPGIIVCRRLYNTTNYLLTIEYRQRIYYLVDYFLILDFFFEQVLFVCFLRFCPPNNPDGTLTYEFTLSFGPR